MFYRRRHWSVWILVIVYMLDQCLHSQPVTKVKSWSTVLYCLIFLPWQSSRFPSLPSNVFTLIMELLATTPERTCFLRNSLWSQTFFHVKQSSNHWLIIFVFQIISNMCPRSCRGNPVSEKILTTFVVQSLIPAAGNYVFYRGPDVGYLCIKMMEKICFLHIPQFCQPLFWVRVWCYIYRTMGSNY